MEIFGSILIGIFVILLFGLGIMGCGFLIREIWGIVKDRKSAGGHRRETLGEHSYIDEAVIAATENQRNVRNNMIDYPATLGEWQDCVPKKKWVTPHIVEESTLEYTGIRAIQL